MFKSKIKKEVTLEQILDGSEPCNFVIVEDTINKDALPIVSSFVGENISRSFEVYILCYDSHPTDVAKKMNLEKVKSLHFYNFFSDPAGWFTEEDDKVAFGVRKELKKCFYRFLKKKTNAPGCLIVVDSLSSFVNSEGFDSLYKQISNINRTQKKENLKIQLVGIVCPDLHINYDSLKVLLTHLSNAWISVDILNKRPPERIVNVSVKIPGGKISKQVAEFSQDSDLDVLIKNLGVPEADACSSKADDKIPPDLITTFKLSLNEEEKVARSELVLPYLKTESGGGNIYYDPSGDDDCWDEEDPDDDLDV